MNTSNDRAVPVPARYGRVTPWIISRDTDSEIRFLSDVFGAVETPGSRLITPSGTIGHVEIELGNSVIMLFDSNPDWASTPSHLRVYVQDAAETLGRATARGGRTVTEPRLLAFGDIIARLRDPQGHLWWIHQHLETVALDELAARFAEPEMLENMAYVQSTLENEFAGR
jgi:uncharacterized glyoxalase superfamily protein PhnB